MSEPRVLTVCRRVAEQAALACGLLIFIASILITLEIVLRNLFDISLNGADELSGYALAITSTWALSATLLARRHIRIDSLYVRLPRFAKLALDLIGLCSMLVFFGFVLRYGWILTERSLNIGARAMTPLATPLAIPQIIWLIGLLVFVATAGLLLVLALSHMVRGQWDAASNLISSRDAMEDVKDELDDMAARGEISADPSPEQARNHGDQPLKEQCHAG